MRTRSVVAVALVLPVVLAGQVVTRRVPRVGAGGESPAYPKELPPQSEKIAEDIYLKQSRSFQSEYPLLSYVHAPGYDDRSASWVTVGAGYSLGYLYKENLAITGDFTQTVYGGPQYQSSVQIGARYYPSLDYERKLSPFVDARGGYSLAYDTYATQIPGSIASAPQYQHDARWANGFGAVGGAGLDYPLWSTFSLTTEMLAARSRFGSVSSSSNHPYEMTQYTFTVGVSYTMFARRAMTYRLAKQRKNLK